jgi:uncharacterized protein YndB with AHSA1/START domain
MVSEDRIEKQILIRAPRGRVWRAITSEKEFSEWFGVQITGEFAPGARCRMTTTHKDHAGIVFYVTIEKMEPERLFSWRWHPGMPDPGVDYSKEPTTLVVFELNEVEGGTLVTVLESGFDQISLTRRAGVFQDNTKGWELQLASLERYAGQAA